MTLYEQAMQHESAGDYGRAFALLRQCLSEDGYDRGEISFHCGWCLENDLAGDRDLAVRFYEKASDEAASVLIRVNGAFRAGWVLMKDRDHERAEAALRRAVELAERSHLDHEFYYNALFWHAVCLESKGQYLEAAERYRLVQQLSPFLAPESLYREIVCNNQVGRYEEALALCRAYPAQSPAGFDQSRYEELHDLIRKEESLLVRCLTPERSL